MRFLVITTALGCIAAGSALAQAPPAPGRLLKAADVRPGEKPGGRSKSRERKPADEALASCLAQWDKSTHMTRREWARACRRVADRLQNLSVN